MKTAKFWKKYTVTVCIAFVLLLGALAVFYAFMDSYEKSQPAYTAQKYTAALTEADFGRFVDRMLPKTLSPYENKTTVSAMRQDVVRNLQESLTVMKNNKKSTTDVPVFSVYACDTVLLDLVLSPEENGSFGMRRWRVEAVSENSSETFLQLYEYKLYVPIGASVSVNGMPVRQEDLAEESVRYAFASPYEKAGVYDWQLYIIPGLLTEPVVTCTLEGEICTAETDGTTVRYHYPDSMKQTYTVKAPAHALIQVNSITLAADTISATAAYPYSTIEANAENLPFAAERMIADLLGPPIVTGTLDGVPLVFAESGNAFVADYPTELLYTCTLRVPTGSHVSVHNASCEPYFSGNEAVFPDLAKYMEHEPMYDVFRITGLYTDPSASVTVEYDGQALSLSFTQDGRDIAAIAGFPVSSGFDPSVGEKALSFVKDYIRYTGQGFNNTEENLRRVLAYTPKNSEVYKQLERSKIGIQFVTPVTSTTYDTLEIANVTRYSDTAYTCSISFAITQMTYHIQQKYAGVYELTLAKLDNEWKLIDMQIITK